jgi:hypothetical protein
VNPLTAVAIAGFVGVALIALRLGRRRAGLPGARRHGRSAAAADARSLEALEAEDLQQLLAAHNARRVARGEPEQSVADIEQRLEREWEELAADRRRGRAPRIDRPAG